VDWKLQSVGKSFQGKARFVWFKQTRRSTMQNSLHRIWAACCSGKIASHLLLAITALMLLMFATACPPPPPPPNPQSLPADANDACPLSSTTFATWFHSGSIAVNGQVDPADSLNNLNPNCDFYQWSQRMFLWLTSPTPPSYGGGGGRIFDSAPFYDVSPPDATGKRTFLPHTAGGLHFFPMRAAQVGPHGLPVIMERSGILLEIQPPKAKAKPLVRDQSGKTVEIVHVRSGENGKPVLLDKAGQLIQAQSAHIVKPTGEKRVSAALMVNKFVIDGIPIFIDPSLGVIDVEQGQAGVPEVLEAQTTANGSLVYYATVVNDVYAYFVTGVKDGKISATQFPTSSSDLNSIIAFATGHGKPNPPFPDPNALAIEVKSSWVVAAGLPNLSSYITMTATIPTYNTSNPNLWTPTGQQTVQLALVGFHVVGSTLNHPEMVWGTFEHFANAPRAAYSYINTSNTTINMPQNTAASWLFCANGSGGPFNTPHMQFTGPPSNNIQSNSPFTISPSDTLRADPFGIDGANAASNTQVISTNNHVLGMLAGDVRSNYILTGATWSFAAGTNAMTNATMETYQQGSNCFDCHDGSPMLGALSGGQGTGLSHIYGGLQQLF
jgi:hypothetical protein